MKHTIFVLAMSLFLPATVNAADIDGKYSITVSKQHSSCGQYVAARDEGRRGNHRQENIFSVWISGYRTAYNAQTPDTWEIAGQTDTESMLLWLENYCKRNPLESFAGAMDLLTNELHPKRIRKAPE